MPRFEHLIKIGTLKNAIKIKSSLDPAASSLIDDSTELKLKKIANSLRINWPASSEEIEKAKERLKRDHIKQWTDLRSQDQEVTDFVKEKSGNVWLKEYHLLKPSSFIDAIKMRTNTYGTRIVLARADKNINIMCRRCRAQPETLEHILGLCQHTKGLRIKRHDEVKTLLAKKLQAHNEVFVEPSIKMGDNLYKPDLVVNNEEQILVVDVTVRYENRDYLQKTAKEKVDKYFPCLRVLKSKYGVDEGAILLVVLGSRGAITPETVKNLKELGVTESKVKTIIMSVLRSSIEMCNLFLYE